MADRKVVVAIVALVAPFAIFGVLLLIHGFMRYSDPYVLAYTGIPNGPYGPPQRIFRPQEKSAGISMMVSGVALIALGHVFSYVIMHPCMSRDKNRYQPSAQRFDAETQTKYPRVLFARYAEQYPHNPEGVLEWHIHKKTKEGKTREQAIKELMQA